MDVCLLCCLKITVTIYGYATVPKYNRISQLTTRYQSLIPHRKKAGVCFTLTFCTMWSGLIPSSATEKRKFIRFCLIKYYSINSRRKIISYTISRALADMQCSDLSEHTITYLTLESHHSRYETYERAWLTVAGKFSVRSCKKGKHNKQVSAGPLVQPAQSLNKLRLNLVLPVGPYWSNILTVKSNLIVSVMVHCTKTCITHKILNYGPKLWKGNILTCLQYLAQFNENWFVTLIITECTNGLNTRLLFIHRSMWLVHGLKLFHSNGTKQAYYCMFCLQINTSRLPFHVLHM